MKEFLKQVVASLVVTVVCFVIFGLALFGLVAGLKGKTPSVKKGSILVFNMSVNITDGPSGFDAQQTIEDAVMGEGPAGSVQLYPLLRGLEMAASDDRIAGLFLHGSLTPRGYGTGYATLRELRGALEKFRRSGKPIHAYLVSPTTRDYYLASAANSLMLNPQGMLMVNGLVAETTYYAGALEKYGVGAQVVRVGKYKSFVEPYIRTNMSPENREQTRQLLGAVWDEIVQAVAIDRNLDPTQVQAIVDKAEGFKPEDALARKLVDKLAYFDEELAALKKMSGQPAEEGTFPQIDLMSYAAVAKKKDHKSANKVAVVYAEGAILDGVGGPGVVGGDSVARQIRELRQNKSVKAIVLRVNSPGGSATASEVIHRELELAKGNRPVVISMGTVAASGGYWISAGGSRIFAEPNTITGSIGILGMMPNVKELANKHGITWDSVKTGKYADVLKITRPKTPEEMALFQGVIDDGYEKFLQLVAKGRNKTKDAVHEIAQGRVWSGRDAEKLGLIDEFGGLAKAIAYAAQRANLGTDWSVMELPEEKGLLEQVSEMLGGDKKPVARVDPISSLLREVGEDLQTLRSLNDPAGVYALIPEMFRIQ
jgi:protease IV